MGADNTLKLVDESLRDGTQSLWGMMMGYHMMEPVVKEISEAGYYSVNLPVHAAQPMIQVRFFKEDPRDLYRMFREKVKDSKSNFIYIPMGMAIDITGEAENKTMIKMINRQFKAWLPNLNQYALMCCCEDEIKNTYPILFPLLRSLGIEPIPYLAIGHSPRHTDEFYAIRVKHLVETYKPISLCLKDVDGLLTPERMRTLLPAVQAVAGGTPFEFHLHGMNGLNTYNAVVAMELGVRKFTTCCPPLAYGSSHLSVYDMINNAREMGISHTMDIEKLNVIEERLTKIGKAYGHPVDNHPLPFDLRGYKHQIPGGVISNTRTQLAQMGIPEKLDEVLDEIPLILEDMGYPVMITPFSQFIVAQAVLNVQLGRWEECLDSMIKFAAGIYGIEEAGVLSMNQNLRDKLLSLPGAKQIKEKADHLVEYMNSEPSEEDCKRRFGMSPDASDEDFILRVVLHGNQELKLVTPGGPEAYKKYL
jgi:oxaloacetate decarboxylase (Na+ extruding) subunit alpha